MLRNWEAEIDEGQGHNRLFLTTYLTLANYHHSLQQLRFSAPVFDEFQTLKNPAPIASAAARSVPALFRIGLTGTAVENRVQDPWVIMDQLSPGSFGSLREFSADFGSGFDSSLEELNKKLFDSFGVRSPVAIRRLKVNAAADLPAKCRVLLPTAMPPEQMECYDSARANLVGAAGGALKALHHIRSVSTYPSLSDHDVTGESLQEQSALLQQVFSVLDDIAAKHERVDVINGNTSIPARQASVKRFQDRLDNDRGFDLLILVPRAAGTGLTLTAANHVVCEWHSPDSAFWIVAFTVARGGD